MKIKTIDIFQSNQELSNWFLKLLICLMMACASVSLVQLTQRMTVNLETPLNIWYLPVLVFLVSIEVFATRNRLESLEVKEKIVYHIAEWIIFAILLKIVIYLVIGVDKFWIDLPLWQKDISNFFLGIKGEDQYLPILMGLFLAWFICIGLATELDVLQSELADFKWEIGQLDNDRQAARQRIAEKIFLVGGAMILVSMVTRLDLKQIWGDTPATQASLANVIVFFLLALVFLSQTQFAFLRGRWFWSQTPMVPHIGRNWIRYSLLFFIIIALIAFLLPTRYTFTLLQVIQVVINFLFQFGLLLLNLLITIISFLIGLVLSLLGSNTTGPQVIPPLQMPQAVLPPSEATADPGFELLKSILFWAVFIAIIGFAIIHFIRQNSIKLSGTKKIPVLGWFLRGVKSIWAWLKGASRQISSTISGGLQRIFQSVPKSISRGMQQFFNFKKLSPRQQVVFYYLRLLERSKRTGVERKPHQTPEQFAVDLKRVIPEVRQEVDDLTESFVDARYSLHPVDSEQTSLVQRLWRKIAKSLKPAKPGE